MSENTEQAQQPAANPELTVVDLQNIRSIIDVAAKRGAFGAGEMTAIGGVYNKLESFLAAVAPQQAPAEGADQTPAAE
jgi:hypothetical protein